MHTLPPSPRAPRPWVALAILATLAPAGTLAAQGISTLPTNAFGAPLRTPAGAAITYSQAELAEQRKQMPPALALPPALLGGGSPQAAPQAADWAFFAFGSGIGAAGMQVSSANGQLELVASMGAQGFGELRYWSILRYDASSQSYGNQVFVSPIYPSGKSIRVLVAGDLLAPSGPEIVIGRQDGAIEIWNQATRKLVSTLAPGVSNLQGITLADVDGDTKVDLVVVSATGLTVLEATGAVKFSIAGASGTDVVVAQMDADASLEIATTSGHVIDVATRATQWFWNNKFGFQLKAGDVDADGKAELIAADQWSWVWCYDIDRQLPKWSLPVSNTGAIELGDIDKDGALELMVGEAQWGSVSGYDTTTLVKEWSINNPEHGTTDVVFGDFDGDSKNEVLWGAGYTSTGKDLLFAGNIQAQQIRWQSVHLDGPFQGPLLGDIDGDAVQEIVTCSTTSDSGYAGGRLVLLDPNTLTVKAISPPVTGSFSSGLADLQLVNIDADAALEVLVVANSATVYDYANGTFTKAWELLGTFSNGYTQARIGDFDKDAKLDVVLGSAQFVHIVDYQTKSEVWKSFYVGGSVKALSILDTDFDQEKEIHALSSDGNVYVFDAKTRSADAILAYVGTKYSALTTWEIVPGYGVVMLGDQTGRIAMHYASAGSYQRVGPVPFRTAAIDGIEVVGSIPLILTGAAGALDIAAGLTSAWTSQVYGDKFGLLTIPIDSKRMIVSAGTYGLAGFVLP